MTKEMKARVALLKKDMEGVYRSDEGGMRYGLRILDRGDLLFFQQGELALICEISARMALINPETIRQWDNGEKIDATARKVIVEKIQGLYKQAYKDELKVYEAE